MAYGNDLAFYAAQGPDHKVNASQPELDEENAFVMTVFETLNPSRPVHFGGAGPIPFTEIEAFCRLAGFDQQDRLELAQQVRAIDLLYLDLLDKRKHARQTLPQPKGGS